MTKVQVHDIAQTGIDIYGQVVTRKQYALTCAHTHTWYTAHLHAGTLGSADTESRAEKTSPPAQTGEQSEHI